jgi:hypothetical protein
MKVAQLDSRSISIVSDTGVRFVVPYRFYWNGHDRPAESIVLSSPDERRRIRAGAHEVRAFFLFGEIRDRITDDASGITLSRTWSMKTPGAVHLGIDAEFDSTEDLACLFPGVHSARGLPPSPLSFLGEKTTYPASLFLSSGRKGVLLFSPSASCAGTPGSIGISRTEVEGETARLRVELRFPGVEEPAGRIGPKPGDVLPARHALIESPGSLERSHDLCLAFSSRDEIAVRGGRAVLERVADRSTRAARGRGPIEPAELADALKSTMTQHLQESGGVAGMRELRDGPWVSASAGLGIAIGLLTLFPDDGRLSEGALRLADFALKGQVPGGFFHESFHVPTGQWRGVRGQAGADLLSVGQSARVAELLLALSDTLERMGRPHEKYLLAGLRFVDFFLDQKGKLSLPGGLHRASSSAVTPDPAPGIAGLEIFFPLSRVFTRTGHDRYRKALDMLVRRFSSLGWDLLLPPSSREGRGPDAAAALLAARLYVEMRAQGYRPVEPPVSNAAQARARAADSARLFVSLLVPWIRVQDEPTGNGPGGKLSLPQSGCLLDSFARQRLLCAGRETAHLLLRLEALSPGETEKHLLASLARECLAAARRVPIGTAFIRHTLWDESGTPAGGRRKGSSSDTPRGIGPVDSRRVATEVLAGLGLAEEFASF